MIMRNIFYITLGIIMGSSLTVVLNSVDAQVKLSDLSTLDLIDEQNYALKYTGMYVSDVSDSKYTVNTYETLCKGFYTVKDTGDSYIYTGYGDLADLYTYTLKHDPVVMVDLSVSSSTINEVPLSPASVDTVSDTGLNNI